MGWLVALLYGLFSFALALIAAVYLYINTRHNPQNDKKPSVQVVVLGDIGRSPRMQYHALSLMKRGMRVDMIGYQESEIHPDLAASHLVHVVSVPRWPKRLETEDRRLLPVLVIFKVLWQIPALFYAMLFMTPPAKYMLVQNPPAIPTLLVGQLVCYLRNTSLCMDWHNYGHTILALKLGPSHPLVRIYQAYESLLSRFAHRNFTVTTAMARSLSSSSFSLPLLKYPSTPPIPLYDRPPSHFQPFTPTPATPTRRHAFSALAHRNNWLPLPTRPYRVLVSSTSWTPDEDFSLLLSALVLYSQLATTTQPTLPSIVLVVTGRGPQQRHYLSQIHAMQSSTTPSPPLLPPSLIKIHTSFLPLPDYAALLATADLGLSLHNSSSGVDLPMKVVDMFGAGLPVLGYGEFEAWGELVKEGGNGRGFGDVDGLVGGLVGLFGSGAGGEGEGEGEGEELERLREGAGRETGWRWEDEWGVKAGDVFV
ncbi:glycosyltransferase family 33 protein [Saccharata proteae CBS 121410]|uniref:Chitobiosyldiphosphodolichol beta-mannosyltransferase n=1 Tax=Saccharata proteae CBS 121410 TaxID=1314787 RepID=A0A9P4HZ04_9PEZI|nr:glycosyltransferase family 33 protein [Saccharata proteae CBS 121410]